MLQDHDETYDVIFVPEYHSLYIVLERRASSAPAAMFASAMRR